MIITPQSDEEKIQYASFVAHEAGVALEAFIGDRPFEAICLLNEPAKAVGVVVFTNFHGHSMELSVAGQRGWLTREHIRNVFDYPFNQHECRRVTVVTARKNRRARRLAEKLGFKLEGVCRKDMPDGQDAMIYGLLKEDCRWL